MFWWIGGKENVGPHFDGPATRPTKHKFHIEKRRTWFGFRLGYRFVCTCSSGSNWVETENYALSLADVHHDMVLLDRALSELPESRYGRNE